MPYIKKRRPAQYDYVYTENSPLKDKMSDMWGNAMGYMPKWDASKGIYADKGVGVWKNLGAYANVANGVYQAGMLGKNLSDLGNENRSTQDLLTDLRFATMSDPTLLSGLDPASKLRAQRLLRGNKMYLRLLI